METVIKGVQHFIGIIDELSKSYPTNVFSDVPVIQKFVFRGIGEESYRLLPNILRSYETNIDGQEISNQRYTAWATEISILKNFIAEASGIVNSIPATDLYRWAEYAQHFGAPMGGDWFGTKRLKTPEEYILGAVIDEVTNIYTLGALIIEIFGTFSNEDIRKRYKNNCFKPCLLDQWSLNEQCFNVAKKATQNDRSKRFQSISRLYEAWYEACNML